MIDFPGIALFAFAFGFPGPLELLILMVLFGPGLAALVVIPSWLVLSRLGLPPLLSLLAALPLANLMLLWAVALSHWPALDESPSGPSASSPRDG
jgi:hypothetical protein